MNEHASVVQVSRHYPADGRRDEVAGVLRVLAEDARKAKGCFGAQLTESDQDGHALVLVARWDSQQAMERFKRQPEYTGFEREIAESLRRAPETELFTTV